MRKRAFFVESNGEEPSCTICGSSLRYRDKVSRIMKRYNGEKAHVMIERRKCQNPDCKKLHRCLPSQLTRFKHFMTDVIEDTVDDIIVPEDPENPGDDIITSPTIRTVAGWKAWVRHNTPNINVFIASLFWKKLQTFLENVASPFWRNVHLHGATYAAPWKQTFFVKSY